MKEITPRATVDAALSVPGSKSLTHRALIVAALARGKSRIQGCLSCEDTEYTLGCLKQMGVSVSGGPGYLDVAGMGGKWPDTRSVRRVFLGNSGTSMRLLLSVFALFRGEYLLDGTPRMRQRPVAALVAALNRLGADARCVDGTGCPPVLIRAGGLEGGKVRVSGEESSQYVSSLLLSAPFARTDVEIVVTGKAVSTPYVDMTLDVMRAFGVSVSREGHRYFRVPAGRGYEGRPYIVEADVSNAAYFWAAAAVTGGRVTIEGIAPFSTRQGDIGFLEILEKMGCRIEKGPSSVTVHGGPLKGIDADMGDMPDLVPTLAAIALFAEGKTVVRNVPHLRYKESDRLGDLCREWSRLGAGAAETADGLVIHGGAPLHEAILDPHDDHRLAMSLAVAGLRVPGLRIRNEACVNKSFPFFWELWDAL